MRYIIGAVVVVLAVPACKDEDADFERQMAEIERIEKNVQAEAAARRADAEAAEAREAAKKEVDRLPAKTNAVTRALAAACDDGTLRSCWLLGTLYGYGDRGVTPNDKHAKRLFRRACTAAVIDGCRHGAKYDGSLLAADAFEPLGRACEAGRADGCQTLIKDAMWRSKKERGSAAASWATTAANWRAKACSAGVMAECPRLTVSPRDATPAAPGAAKESDRLPRDAARIVAQSAAWCDKDHAAMCVFVGMRYAFDGISGALPTDRDHAAELFERGCNDKTALGCAFAGDLAMGPPGPPPAQEEIVRAIRFYERGCQRHERQSCQRLATILEKSGRPEDLVRAAGLFHELFFLWQDNDALTAALRIMGAK